MQAPNETREFGPAPLERRPAHGAPSLRNARRSGCGASESGQYEAFGCYSASKAVAKCCEVGVSRAQVEEEEEVGGRGGRGSTMGTFRVGCLGFRSISGHRQDKFRRKCVQSSNGNCYPCYG